MQINLIMAHTDNLLVGLNRDGKHLLPWHLPEDMGLFKRLTEHHVVILGRTTFESFGRPQGLPNRQHVVLTTDTELLKNGACKAGGGVRFVSSYTDALIVADLLNIDKDRPVWVIGGSKVYNQAVTFDYTDHPSRAQLNELHVSRVKDHVIGKHLLDIGVYLPVEWMTRLAPAAFPRRTHLALGSDFDYYIMAVEEKAKLREFTPTNSQRHRVETCLQRAVALIEEGQQLSGDEPVNRRIEGVLDTLEDTLTQLRDLQLSHPHTYVRLE